jgi:flagellar hook protein FlgE
MNSSFYNGISGVKTHQFGLDITANNITNINTAGYKNMTSEFSTIFSTQLQNSLGVSSSDDKGLGSTASATSIDMSTGSLIQTDSQFDMAIGGKGWFDIQDVGGSHYYTRNGSFSTDRDGNLVDTFGNYVMGQSANNISNGVITNEDVGDIELTAVENRSKIVLPNQLTLPPEQTTIVKMRGNLNSTPIYDIEPFTGNKIEVANKTSYRSILYRSDGGKNFLDISFQKIVPQGPTDILWNATAVVTNEGGEELSSQNGQFIFDTYGFFKNSTLNSVKSDGIDVSLDFGGGNSGLVSYNSEVENKSILANGYTSGSLKDYGIDSLGNIEAIFDNGKSIPVYKVIVVNFQNENGLKQTSPIYFQESPNSGSPFFLKDKDNQIVQQNIINRHLEQSNVDLSTAMTELIVMQKAFDASSKSITTSDQLIQNAINMKK